MDISFAVQVTSCIVLLVLYFTALDSTKSRDRKADQQILPVTSVPDIDALFTVYKLLSCSRTILMKFSAL